MRPASTRRSSRSRTTSTSRPGCVKSCAPAASTVGTASGPDVIAPGSATAATQARSHSSFPGRSSYSAAKGCRISARYEATGRPSAQLLSERGRIYQYLRRRGPREDVQEIHGCFQQRAPSRDIGPPVYLSHPVLPDPVAGFVPEPSEPDDAHVLPRRQKQRRPSPVPWR
jgi:hypothetical protein